MKISRVLLGALMGVVVLANTASAGWHLRMTDSFPKKDQELTESPTELRVWFNQDVSMAVSRLGLHGADGEIEVGRAVETDDPKSFKAPVNANLAPGEYTVTWRTAGDDGHVQRGRFTFSMTATSR